MTQVLRGNARKAPYLSQSDLAIPLGLAAGSEDLSVLICEDRSKRRKGHKRRGGNLCTKHKPPQPLPLGTGHEPSTHLNEKVK